MEMKEIIQAATKALYEKKAQDIVALDVTDLTVITDAMVIASGRNTMQVHALAEAVEDKLSELGLDPVRKEGYQDAHWVVLDYGTVLVHVFHTNEREFYRLDKLWERDGNIIPLEFEQEE